MKFTEVELKYRAEEISLNDFHAFCKNRQPSKFLHVSGYDHFFESTKSEDSFCRHRVGVEINQLTFKKKTQDANNYIRTEHNLDLDGVSEEQVKALCAEFGYKAGFSLFKTCFIYNYDYYTMVYYICYDLQMKELGRFVEIELKEDYPWESKNVAWDELVTLERLCKPLGINAQSRVRRSLFELFK